MGGGLTFTWSCAHSLLHHAWDKNQSGCRMHPRRPCFPLASEAQREWEASIGAGSQRQFTIPWLMRAVHGDKVRLIALLREPAERMHSAYYFWPQYRRRWGLGKKANALPDGFLEYVQHVLPAFESCLRSAKLSAVDARAAHFSPAEMPPALPLAAGRHQLRETAAEAAERVALEHCAINFESLSSDNEAVYYHADQLLKSLYVAYVPSWLKAFGSERMLFLRAEDYWDGRRDTLGKVFNFLGLGPPPAAAFDAIVDRPISVLTGSNATFWGEKRIVNSHLAVPHPAAPAAGHGHTRSRIKAPMNAEARALLRDFFRPHNRRLARVLGDERFRWE